jgi:hypothetical protein
VGVGDVQTYGDPRLCLADLAVNRGHRLAVDVIEDSFLSEAREIIFRLGKIYFERGQWGSALDAPVGGRILIVDEPRRFHRPSPAQAEHIARMFVRA